MRRLFARLLYKEMAVNKNIVVLVGDVGYGMFDTIMQDYPNHFYNVGAAEQLLIGAGIGLALEGKIPICYSITPFLLYRPYEFIRNYIINENIPVKLVGSGRGGDYAKDGFSHWETMGRDIFACTPICQYRPLSNDELEKWFHDFINSSKPAYLNLRR